MGPSARETNAYIAGILGGGLYLAGAAGVLLLLPFTPEARDHWPWIVACALSALALAGIELWFARTHRDQRVAFHIFAATGLGAAAVCVAASGGMSSPVIIVVLFTTTWTAFYAPGRLFLLYVVATMGIAAVPLAYDSEATFDGWGQWVAILVPAAIALGHGLSLGRKALEDGRLAAEAAALEQAALRRVAIAAAEEAPALDFYAVVAREAAVLLGATGGTVIRPDGDEYVLEGVWASNGQPEANAGDRYPIPPGGTVTTAMRTGRPARAERERQGPTATMSYEISLAAPVRNAGRPWGALVVVSDDRDGLSGPEVGELLGRFATLVSTAIAATEERERLVERATTDPLTGAANHRAFHERLRVEVARALRHERPLALVLLDIDHFKWVNDTLGHEQGDHVLRDVVLRLREALRGEDVLARLGGDELAMILPETDAETARDVVERARARVSGEPVSGVTITVSAGVCDLATAGADPERLVRFADGALYWGKLHGRDSALIYDPAVVHELSEHERVERLERSQALRGIRALAKAIDAKDPSTHEHSERVAGLAAALAASLDWSPERVRALREAALVHDVGKIGVPDAILTKPGALNAEEYCAVKAHAALGAEMVDDVLSPEQARWIRHHHERPDGRGYPDGLTWTEIPPAAALLAMADSWDVMTAERPYSAPKDYATALSECRSLAGVQFTTEAIAALESLHVAGRLVSLTPLAA